ncbi:MAG: hypothetical protein K1X65_00660 [Caldilineales bacterium]|nr:hypothetical protein [Caldilineales bacterium]MCW5859322.1 hypothetical protein [Caldilineales bacterium]
MASIIELGAVKLQDTRTRSFHPTTTHSDYWRELMWMRILTRHETWLLATMTKEASMNLRTRFTVIWYSLVHFRPLERRLLAVAVVGLVASVVSTAAGNTRLGLWLAIGTLIVDVLLFLVDLYFLPKPRVSDMEREQLNYLEYRGSDPVPLGALMPSPQEKQEGFSTVELTSNESVILSNDIDIRLFEDKHIEVRLRPKYESRIIARWQDQWEDMQDFLVLYSQGKPLWNEDKLALCSPLERNTEVVHLGKTTYFTSIVTNEACTHRIKSKSRVIRDLRIMFPYSMDDYILPIETSWMSNHIGISTIAITCEGHLIHWKQRKERVHQNPDQLVPTGSGSLDWNDAKHSSGKDLLSVIKYGMARELFEENKLDFRSTPITISELAKHTLVLGYYRWIRRGGKPEFVGITKVPLPAADFVPNWENLGEDEKGHQIEHPMARSAAELEAICSHYLDAAWLQERRYQISTPLSVTMHRLRSALQSQTQHEKLKRHCAFDEMSRGCK